MPSGHDHFNGGVNLDDAEQAPGTMTSGV